MSMIELQTKEIAVVAGGVTCADVGDAAGYVFGAVTGGAMVAYAVYHRANIRQNLTKFIKGTGSLGNIVGTVNDWTEIDLSDNRPPSFKGMLLLYGAPLLIYMTSCAAVGRFVGGKIDWAYHKVFG